MTDRDKVVIETVEEFLVHALELEEASQEQYEELADSMQVHNNLEVAELFRRLAGYSHLHAEEVRELAGGQQLPELAPWDFKWRCPGAPESICMEEAHYLMTKSRALEVARFNEVRGRDFYLQVAAGTSSPEVRKLALEMAEEEGWHVQMLEEWRAELEEEQPLEDLDPPNTPE